MPLSLLMLFLSGTALATTPTVYEIDPTQSTVGIAWLDSRHPFEASGKPCRESAVKRQPSNGPQPRFRV